MSLRNEANRLPFTVRVRAGWLSILILAFAVILIRRAWICDDAYITFRTIDNLIHGFRLTWNVTERVQAYTHPLWMLLLSIFYRITGEIYLTSLVVSIVLSITALWLLGWWGSKGERGLVLALVGLSLSKAFVDYSTSGLENPLSHLLIIVFFLLFFRADYSRRGIFFLSLVASLGILNRMDVGLIFLPALAFALVKGWKNKVVGAMLLGQTPFILWEAFSLFYYGFPFPNTAYAKLNTGIPANEYFQQGLLYLLNSLEWDPITLLLIGCGLLAAVFATDHRLILVGLGALCYLGYVVLVGGDFMSGRFLTASLFTAIIPLARFDDRNLSDLAAVAIAGVFAFVGLGVPNATWHVSDYGKLDQGPVHIGRNGILDERMLYYGGTGLLNARRNSPLPDFYWAQYGESARVEGRKLVDNYGIGMFGFYAGPGVYVIDKLALADPLLARLPAPRKVNWRIGHLERDLPEGYYQTLLSGKNMLVDENLATYYDKLTLITRGSLFSAQRFVEIWKMNTGQYDYLIRRDAFLYPDMVFLDLKQLVYPIPLGTACGSSSVFSFQDSGVEISLGHLVKARQIEIWLDHNDRYRVEFYQGKDFIGSQIVPTAYLKELDGVSPRFLSVTGRAASRGINRIRIFPLAGDGVYCLGAIQIN